MWTHVALSVLVLTISLSSLLKLVHFCSALPSRIVTLTLSVTFLKVKYLSKTDEPWLHYVVCLFWGSYMCIINSQLDKYWNLSFIWLQYSFIVPLVSNDQGRIAFDLSDCLSVCKLKPLSYAEYSICMWYVFSLGRALSYKVNVNHFVTLTLSYGWPQPWCIMFLL